MTINFAVIFLVGLILYRMLDLPLPDGDLAMVLICAVVWSAGYIFLWIARCYPLFGWFIFGFEFRAPRRRPSPPMVTADNRRGFGPSLTQGNGTNL